jgi:hypothetical protein
MDDGVGAFVTGPGAVDETTGTEPQVRALIQPNATIGPALERSPSMAVCALCQGEMLEGISCGTDPIIVLGKVCPPIPFGSERARGVPRWLVAAATHCNDCGVPKGGIHHHGCDIEECPVCHDQYISCACDEPFDHPVRRQHPRCTVRSRYRRSS